MNSLKIIFADSHPFIQKNKYLIGLYLLGSIAYSISNSYYDGMDAIKKYNSSSILPAQVTLHQHVRDNIHPCYNFMEGLIWPYSMYKNILPYLIIKSTK